MNSQMEKNSLVESLRSQVDQLTFGSGILLPSLTKLNPIRAITIWRNTGKMNEYIMPWIEKRYEELRRGQGQSNKSILDLILLKYISENQGKNLDADFKRFTTNQVKQFLFSGHDTTSSTICYLFFILATRPEVVSRLRAEHATVFPADFPVSSAIESDPKVLNKVPYTVAVIKEVMRLYPAVSSTKIGQRDLDITGDSDIPFPTEELMLWYNPQAIHRDPALWPKADDFIPERFLVGPEDSLHPVKGSWRPFSHGPRNCIGQELAMMEMKVVLILTAREFNFCLAYEELDRISGKSAKPPTVYGERAYQIKRSQPSEDLPCHVSLNMITGSV